ncbi:hypothetical protein CEXT_537841 [Caerostris extrusa]|uniref:Uncharacterized protein n=1 Tax=Caerostris extrusa TaxID=172846 RepID=A0AAV4MPF9_CAEEX|nr:hypothetical protein CEXT_537841 [Caerostris extrusa]
MLHNKTDKNTYPSENVLLSHRKRKFISSHKTNPTTTVHWELTQNILLSLTKKNPPMNIFVNRIFDWKQIFTTLLHESHFTACDTSRRKTSWIPPKTGNPLYPQTAGRGPFFCSTKWASPNMSAHAAQFLLCVTKIRI